MERPSLTALFDECFVVTGHTFPVEHKERAIAWARSEAALLRNSVAIHLRNGITGDTHYGFFHPDGHYSHFSQDEERRMENAA